jgi:hypothetical protein
MIYSYITKLQSQQIFEVFVSCFCEHDNLLSQWRGYGGDTGIAIGFSREEVSKKFGFSRLEKVSYSRQDQTRIFELLFDVALRQFTKNVTTANEAVLVELYSERMRILTEFLLPIFKDFSFSEENEWRLVTSLSHPYPMSEWNFRPRNGNLVPYLEVTCDGPSKLPIRFINIGPSQNQSNLLASIPKLLARYDYHDVQVNYSRTPFRR